MVNQKIIEVNKVKSVVSGPPGNHKSVIIKDRLLQYVMCGRGPKTDRPHKRKAGKC
jgi:hypothetical protein